MEGSRLRILNHLQWHSCATVDQLSRYMGLASATVRRHLDILQRDHLVAFQQVKKKTGRPEYTYFLTEAGQELLPKDYDRLLGRLLHELSTLPQDDVGNRDGKELLRLLLHRMAQQTVASTEQGAEDSFSQRVARAVVVLEQEKFQPEIEKTNGSIRIYFHNCPFRSVALGNGSVCDYDRLLLSTILGTEVIKEQGIRTDNSAWCCYLVSAPSQQG